MKNWPVRKAFTCVNIDTPDAVYKCKTGKVKETARFAGVQFEISRKFLEKTLKNPLIYSETYCIMCLLSV